ncbi:MAG: LemA family protein [Oscillospiraceae bacterium]|jgi:LemA protein|nr:LemA family protein [Oscillospiraceae bacterium]
MKLLKIIGWVFGFLILSALWWAFWLLILNAGTEGEPPQSEVGRCLIIGIITAAAIVIIFGIITGISKLNKIYLLRETAKSAFSNIDIYKTRADRLYSQANDAINRYILHESDVQKSVAESRKITINSSIALHAVVESYPDLKANTGMQQLLSEIVKSEDYLSSTKTLYNTTVKTYNSVLSSFPINIIRRLMKLKAMEYYTEAEPEAEPEITIKFDFDN